MILHNCNPTPKCFELWNLWSKQSDNYDGRDVCAYKWNSFKFGFFNIGSLIHFAKYDNPEKCGDVWCSLDEPLFDSIKFNSEYLLSSEQENIKDNKSFISKHIIEWAVTEIKKILAIKSTYDTGKTKIINKILREFGFKKVLFISYR